MFFGNITVLDVRNTLLWKIKGTRKKKKKSRKKKTFKKIIIKLNKKKRIQISLSIEEGL
mgnify:CR=1 FL=1